MRPWPHAPTHHLIEQGTYLVTASTLHHQQVFRGTGRLRLLEESLLGTLERLQWECLAWAVFSNHYHIVVATKPGFQELSRAIQSVHKFTGRKVNELDDRIGRKVWHNYFETRLTFERSLLARLKYVHYNPQRHGIVADATTYPFCSARWFETMAPTSYVETVRRFKDDRISEEDGFEVSWDEEE